MDRLEQFVFSGGNIGHFYRTNPEMLTNKCLKVSFREPISEIPDFLLCNTFDDNLQYNYDSVLLHLCSEWPLSSKRLIRGALQAFEYSLRDGTIRGVNMANGGVYYGIPGVIFDEDFSILFMMTSTLSIDRENKETFITRHNCRISPRVFQRADFTIEKAIIKKVIPFCATHIVDGRDYPYIGSPGKADGTNIKIIIDDIDQDFIQTTVAPKISDTQDMFQKVLKDNIQDVLSVI